MLHLLRLDSPAPLLRLDPRPDRSPVVIRPTRDTRWAVRLVLAAGLAFGFLVLTAGPAVADNCGSVGDTCRGTFIGGATAAVGAATGALAPVAGAALGSGATRTRLGKPPHWSAGEANPGTTDGTYTGRGPTPPTTTPGTYLGPGDVPRSPAEGTYTGASGEDPEPEAEPGRPPPDEPLGPNPDRPETA